MKCAVAAVAMAASAQAFVPVAPLVKVSVPSQMQMNVKPGVEVDGTTRSLSLPFANKPKNLNGELVGDVGFDPFKFSDKGDLAKFRRAELKHGRVSMLAVVGALLQERWSIQGPDFKTTKNLFQAVTDTPPIALLQLFAFIGAYEIASTAYEAQKGRVPGDVGFDPLKLSKDGINEKWALSELKHGRLAMIAFAGFLAQQAVSPGQSILTQTFEWARSFG